jgi:DNA-binding PucR family transcriptional regulator
MLEKLALLYKNDLTTNDQEQSNDYLWLQTENGQIFGIHRSRLTEKEEQLLQTLFEPLKRDKDDYYGKWYQYIYKNKFLPESISKVRFYYFYSNRAIEEREIFSEIVSGVIIKPSIVWLSSQHGWIVDESPSSTVQIDDLVQLVESVTSDFYIQLKMFIGQLHQVNQSIKNKIQQEIKYIKKFQETLSLKNKVFTFSDVLAFHFVTCDKPFSNEFLSDFLISAFRDHELIQTIKQYIECNLNVTQTAKKMFMHRNSVQYRIDKFIELTGIDIRQFKEAFTVYLLILFDEFQS